MDFSDTTVVIPALEEPGLWEVVAKTRKALPGAEILVLWKGYNDRAPKFKEKGVRAIKQESRGKGTVIIQVQRHRYVKTEIICFIDGDATYEPKDFIGLIGKVRKGYGMALGNRFARLDRRSMPEFIEFGNKVITVVANVLYFMWLRDSQTGIRAIRTSAFQSLDLREKGFGIESEMNIKMRKSGYRLVELPARYYVRVGESKQMKVIDGLRLLGIDFKFLFYRPGPAVGRGRN
ncbi:MAG: glycosyltransferase [Candidatus Micrarchaeota archaeon]|nr:glycosyltransferase [Candidatus Micrarchaeota archaeon]